MKETLGWKAWLVFAMSMPHATGGGSGAGGGRNLSERRSHREHYTMFWELWPEHLPVVELVNSEAWEAPWTQV